MDCDRWQPRQSKAPAAKHADDSARSHNDIRWGAAAHTVFIIISCCRSYHGLAAALLLSDSGGRGQAKSSARKISPANISPAISPGKR